LHLDMPVPGSASVWAILLALAAIVAVFRFRAGVIPVLAGCALTGLLLHLMGALA
jgi:chromate transporter